MRGWNWVALALILLPAAATWADQDTDESTRPLGRYFFKLLDGRSSPGQGARDQFRWGIVTQFFLSF